VIADGAMGTLLQDEVARQGVPARWSATELVLHVPDAVLRIHRAYVDAGAEILLTNTFSASRPQLLRRSAAHRLRSIHEAAAHLAREAAGERVVLGDLGPLGAFFPPMGTLREDDARRAYAEQADSLAATGAVDGFLIETQYDLREVVAAIAGVREASSLPIAATISFDAHGRTMMGVSPREAALRLRSLDIAAIGANCGRSIDDTLRAIEAMHDAAPEAPLWAKPNAGIPRRINGRTVYPLPPADFAQSAVAFARAGVRVFGGCCGTTPDHIRAAADALSGG